MTHHVVARAEGSSEGDSASTIEDKIRSLNASHGVVIYSKSWCPFCSQAKQVFDGLDQEYFALELDEIEEGADVNFKFGKAYGCPEGACILAQP